MLLWIRKQCCLIFWIGGCGTKHRRLASSLLLDYWRTTYCLQSLCHHLASFANVKLLQYSRWWKIGTRTQIRRNMLRADVVVWAVEFIATASHSPLVTQCHTGMDSWRLVYSVVLEALQAISPKMKNEWRMTTNSRKSLRLKAISGYNDIGPEKT